MTSFTAAVSSPSAASSAGETAARNNAKQIRLRISPPFYQQKMGAERAIRFVLLPMSRAAGPLPLWDRSALSAETPDVLLEKDVYVAAQWTSRPLLILTGAQLHL